MVPCINASVAFTSANRRNQVLAALEQDKNSKLRFGVDQLDPAATKVGPFGLLVILRFMTMADRDSFVATMLGFATGQFTPVTGSWYRLHDCLHDEGGSCPEGTTFTWDGAAWV